MKVLIDTSIWSSAFRRNHLESPQPARILAELIEEQRVEIIGPIRQELLSGIRTHEQYLQLRNKLQAFVDLDLTTKDFERAAEMFNLCRTKGIQGSNTDFLICAVSERHHLSIFTTDKDFHLYAKYLPILLFQPHDSINRL